MCSKRSEGLKFCEKNLQKGCEKIIIQVVVKNVTIKAVTFIRHLLRTTPFIKFLYRQKCIYGQSVEETRQLLQEFARFYFLHIEVL